MCKSVYCYIFLATVCLKMSFRTCGVRSHYLFCFDKLALHKRINVLYLSV